MGGAAFGVDLYAILPFVAIGFAAQIVDGALGMAFGVITNTLLVGVLGMPPAQASQREPSATSRATSWSAAPSRARAARRVACTSRTTS